MSSIYSRPTSISFTVNSYFLLSIVPSDIDSDFPIPVTVLGNYRGYISCMSYPRGVTLACDSGSIRRSRCLSLGGGGVGVAFSMKISCVFLWAKVSIVRTLPRGNWGNISPLNQHLWGLQYTLFVLGSVTVPPPGPPRPRITCKFVMQCYWDGPCHHRNFVYVDWSEWKLYVDFTRFSLASSCYCGRLRVSRELLK